MKLPYFQVDAFTNRLFSGNPAGVCPLESWLEDDVMQSIAFENGLAETSFTVLEGDGFGLRSFTPAIEMDLCGHATLAAAHVLNEHRGVATLPIVFRTRSGRLSVSREGKRWVLDFPSRPAEVAAPDEMLSLGLGKAPMEVRRARDYLAVFGSEAEVRAIQPDFAALRRLDCLGVIATAPGEECDFVYRFFAPSAGIPEDPATGSAQCTLIPYWAERLGRTQFFSRQLSPRGGELHGQLAGERVLIGGEAVTYSEGAINAP